MTMPEKALPREKGSETAACPTCDGPVPVLVEPYGATHPGACPKCHPARETASASVPRETGTQVAAEGGV